MPASTTVPHDRRRRRRTTDDPGARLGRRRCRRRARPRLHRAPRGRPERRADPDPLLRRLPLRPAPGPQRVEEHRLSLRARPRDRRPRRRGRQRGHAVQGGRPRRRRLHGRLVPDLPASCREGLEQYCEKVPTFTYNSPDPHTGGDHLRRLLREHRRRRGLRAARLRQARPRRRSAPLLCAGITTYSPLRHWKVGPGQKVGIVGLGGLGHMGVKFAHAFGAQRRRSSRRRRQDGGRPAARRRRGRGLARTPRRWRSTRRPLRLHPRYGVGEARHQRLPRRC